MEASGPFALGLAIPVVQAPIGGSARPELASAVSNAGGLGGLALTWSDPETARARVTATRAKTDGLFYGNFALAFPPVALKAALEAGLRCVTFSFGDPAVWIELVRRAGATVGVQVGSVEQARRALAHEPEFLVCQGVEAGGHLQSGRSLAALLPEVLALASGLPVFAAGGLATGDDLRAALDAGASGAVFGTRFLATRQSRAHPAFKRRLTTARSEDAVVTTCFGEGWPDAPHRVLRNETLTQWESAGCPKEGRPGDGDPVGRYPNGDVVRRYAMDHPTEGVTGDPLNMCLYAGAGVGAIRDLPDAGDLVRRLWSEAQGRPPTR